jgi:hypothetical protein
LDWLFRTPYERLPDNAVDDAADNQTSPEEAAAAGRMRFLAFEELNKSDDGSDDPAEDSEGATQTVDGDKDNTKENTAIPVAVRSRFYAACRRSICILLSLVGFNNT